MCQSRRLRVEGHRRGHRHLQPDGQDGDRHGAPDDATPQKGIEALAAAGYYGRLETKAVRFPRDSGTTKGKVSSLTPDRHPANCHGDCCKAIKTAVKRVPGVTGDTAKPRGDTFEVTGDYEATVLIRALHTADFHVKVKKWSMKNFGSANQTSWSAPG